MHMGHYLKKFAISGTISAVFFAGFLYFIYGAEGAKYEGEKAREPQKQYEESIIAQVNSEVAQTMEGLSREGYALAAQPPAETIVYDDAALSIATAIQNAPSIPSITIPLVPVPATIPSIVPVTIPAIPSPQPAPTAQPALAAPVQPKPIATQPRTTVS